MSKDVRFLRQNNLMDYSLLLGIEKIQKNKLLGPNNRNNISESECKNFDLSSLESKERTLGELMQKKHQFMSRS